MGYRIGIAGASGYAGGELIRLVDSHPDLELHYLAANTSAGKHQREVHPQLSNGDRVLSPVDVDAMSDLDVVFLAMPHGASAMPAMGLLDRGVRVVDLGSDFRLDSAARYSETYGGEHPRPDQLGRWPYGLPELFRESIRGADRVAVPGCYPTAAALALAPLARAGAIAGTFVVSAVSGATGAGRSADESLSFGAVAEGVRPYKVGVHRHRPEIEQAIAAHSGMAGVAVAFTPHLVPMQRGLLATCHATAPGGDAAALRSILDEAYAGEAFVSVIDDPPQTRWVVGTNRALLGFHLDRTGTAIVMCAIDNLVKGAAGQAVQCANLMLGLDETSGLPTEGWLP
jgi:N-acetyl-gamma-glutamyl-phosphate reductase